MNETAKKIYDILEGMKWQTGEEYNDEYRNNAETANQVLSEAQQVIKQQFQL